MFACHPCFPSSSPPSLAFIPYPLLCWPCTAGTSYFSLCWCNNLKSHNKATYCWHRDRAAWLLLLRFPLPFFLLSLFLPLPAAPLPNNNYFSLDLDLAVGSNWLQDFSAAFATNVQLKSSAYVTAYPPPPPFSPPPLSPAPCRLPL